uniref:rRNA-processing protein FYV7 n=1 Tax=Anopheles atroparvus TaxID=41427 RepID=A0A182JB03_ANOAO
MKTDNKSNKHQRKGGPGGGYRGNKPNDNRPQKKKNGSFFRAVPESEKKSHQQRPGGAGGSGPPAGKRGPGVQKTTAFKPPQHRKGQGQRHNGSKHNHNPQKGAQKGQPKDHKRGPPPAKGKNDAAQPFPQGKPEKVNYCLAPERLEAQARAIRQFEREQKEKQLEGRKLERHRQHKLMTQKTRKGQPVMQGRMELLLEKVKKTVGVYD